jgi:membrane-bound lytic murein transglycosylase D
MEKPIQMTPVSRTAPLSFFPSPSFSFLRFRLVSLAFLLVMAVLAGCATQPTGLPDDPVLSTGPGTVPGQRIPVGPLRAITPGQVNSFPIASTEPPKELWDRIRRGFAMPDLQNERVTDREQWYASRPEYIQRMTERSSSSTM